MNKCCSINETSSDSDNESGSDTEEYKPGSDPVIDGLLVLYSYFAYFLWLLWDSFKLTNPFITKEQEHELGPVPVSNKSILQLSEDYVSRMTDRFLTSYQSSNIHNMNENVDPLFYESTDSTLNDNSIIEEQWKTRVLLESTPRGLVAMHYDVYKRGFVYYSDNQSIPYSILNAIAIRYVLTYRCRDFFMDDEVTPSDHPSPLIPVKAKATTDKPKKSTMDTSAFAKLKQYNVVTKPADGVIPKEYNRNKFICLGKMANFSFLKKNPLPKKKTSMFSAPSAYMNDLESEHDLQTRILETNTEPKKEVIQYSDFKRHLRKKKSQ